MSPQLPKEIEQYVASLNIVYERKNLILLQRLLVNAKIIIEEISYDNWDGGQYGFQLRLQVPEAIFSEVIDTKVDYEKKIAKDINKLKKISGEFIDVVSIEMQLSEVDNWREQSGLLLQQKKHISNNVLQRIWKPECIRVFISHTEKNKAEAGKLKDELERYGISGFVAHKDIQPTKEWMDEIENALLSMDVFVALMAKDFHDSKWTDQEAGIAIGRNILIIPVKLGKDPYGFIGKYQALSGTWDDIPKMTKDIFRIIVKDSITGEIITRAVIHAFKNSSSYNESNFFIKEVLPCFEKLGERHIQEIISAFNENSQINMCFAKDNLRILLSKWTKNQYTIIDGKLVEDASLSTHIINPDDIPF
ncbi:MAG: toll/interleukin-1 receptor domain-containing protein [Planctomycetes bacterium]|nr:toll/interleukin-1 receptor domain-containing protein [Planctomycetota bacterium]